MTTALLTRTSAATGRFGAYLAEILRSEGLVDLERIDLDALPPEGLAEALDRFDSIVVSRCPLWRSEIDLLLARAEAGAGLVLVRPSRLLARALGLRPLDRQAPAGLLVPAADAPAELGLGAEPTQLPVPVERFEPDGWAGATTLAAAAGDGPEAPALIRGPYGTGSVAVITYDLAEAVARLRQGDPGRIGTRANGVLPYRQMDLTADGIDRDRWHLPQADRHGELLAGLVTAVTPTPVPRWWYYPEPETTSVVIQDSDDDWSTREQFEAILAAAEEQDVRLTFYLMLGERETVLDADDVRRLRERGHSFGIHHDGVAGWDDAEDPELTLQRIVRSDIETFRGRFGSTPLVNRNHCLIWQGWAELSRLYAELGVRMELNAQGTGECWTGYQFGSARPLRHVDLDGTVIDVFQQPTQVFDDLSMIDRLGGQPVTEAQAVADHLRRCRDETFEPLSMQSHPVSFAGYSAAFFTAVWAHARELGLPIWSAEDWTLETLARDRSTLETVRPGAWTALAYGGPAEARTLLLPIPADQQILVDGIAVTPIRRTVHGIDHALIRLTAAPTGTRHEITLA